MGDLNELFSSKEIKEIGVFKEACQDMLVNQEPVKCFALLSDVLTRQTKISDIPNSDLLAAYAQLKLFSKTWRELEWIDNRLLAKITPKAKTLIAEELKRRKNDAN
ncbi:MAG TPA: hypothetical protein VEC37_17385 [Bacillota bacterium]|nr:hypothetical protein [Bacillota bacterium]